MKEDIDLVEYWKYLHMDWIVVSHNVDVGKPYGKEFAPTGEMWSIACGFTGNHLNVMYNKGMGVRSVMQLSA